MHNRRNPVVPVIALLFACAATASGQTVHHLSRRGSASQGRGGFRHRRRRQSLGSIGSRATSASIPLTTCIWSASAQSGGTLNAVTASVNGLVDSQFKVLNRGVYNAVNPLNEISGARFPINTTTYTRLSFKIRTSSSAVPNVYWFHTMAGDPTNGSFPLGDSAGVRFTASPTPGAWRIITVDLPGTPVAGLRWEGCEPCSDFVSG